MSKLGDIVVSTENLCHVQKLQALTRLVYASASQNCSCSIPLGQLYDMVLWLWLVAAFFVFRSYAVQLNRQTVDLQRDRLSAGYRKTLDASFDRLTIWCTVQGRPLPETLENDVAAINNLVVDHVQFLFREQYGLSAGRHAVLAVQTKFRSLRGRLTVAWDSIRSWEQLAPISLRVPMPALVLQAMFTFAMLTGFTSVGKAARDWISFGVGLITCFDGLLRPGEWALLTAGKALMPSSRLARINGRGLLTIVNGKNRRVFGRIQIAMVDSPQVVSWLTWLCNGMEGHMRLLPGGAAAFRKYFKLTCEALGLTSLKLTPASLRAGGATARFARGQELAQLKWWGRWASLATLEHHVQEAAALMVMMTLEDSTLDRLEKIVLSGTVFNDPPCRSWQFYFSRAHQRLPPRWMQIGSLKSSGRPKL